VRSLPNASDPADIIDLLTMYPEARRRVVRVLGEIEATARGSEPWMPASFSTGWRRFAKAHGFGTVTFHTLRHGAATLMLASGVPDAVAISVMGHADTKILRRYQDVVSDLKRDAATRMDGLLGDRRV
jgi:integrase